MRNGARHSCRFNAIYNLALKSRLARFEAGLSPRFQNNRAAATTLTEKEKASPSRRRPPLPQKTDGDELLVAILDHSSVT